MSVEYTQAKKKIIPKIIGRFILVTCIVTNCSFATGQEKMKSKTNCELTALERTTLIIKEILKDVGKTYSHVGGGGITNIKQIATDSYAIFISQEERIDQITYTFKISGDCKANIIKKEISAVNPTQ